MSLNYYEILKGLNITSEDLSVSTQILNGSVDPSAGGGVAAETGSLFLRSNGALYTKVDTADTDWDLIGADMSGDIASLSAQVINNTNNITTISGDLISLSGQVVNHTHVKADITDFTESDYVHTTGNETIGGDKTFTDNVIVNGDLIVNGTTTTISSVVLNVTDNIITLNSGETGAGVTEGSAGIEVDRGTLSGVSLIWNETSDTWQATEDGATFYDILHDGNIGSNVDLLALSSQVITNTGNITNNATNISILSGDIGTLNSGNYILGNNIGQDLGLLDSNLLTVSGDLNTLESIVGGGPLSAGTYIVGDNIAADLVRLDTAITELEPEGTIPGLSATTVLDSFPLVDGNLVKWHILAELDSNSLRIQGAEIHAVHNSVSADYNVASRVRIGANFGVTYSVAVNGANLELSVSASAASTFKFKRIVVI